jgi:hypothetical protein
MLKRAQAHLPLIALVIAAVFTPTVVGAQGLNGTYAGTYRCGQSVTNMKLSVTTTASGELTGHFTFYLPAGTQQQAYTYGLFGQFNPRSARFVLNPTQWEGARPANAAMVGMNGTWDSNELTGTITSDANCTFQLERDQAAVSRAAAPPASAPTRSTQAAQRSPTPQGAANSPAASLAALDKAMKELDQADKETEKADQAFADPVLKWRLVTKKDRLSDEVTTQLSATTGLQHGDFIQANALCNDNGIALFFTLGSLGTAKSPEFAWDQSTTSGPEPTMEVRMRVDGRPVHVAQGSPDKKGNSFFANTLGVLFYEPNLVARSARETRNAATTGFAPLDSVLGGFVGAAAQTNAENLASSSAGPLRDAVEAKSIRVELPVNAYVEAPILDLNPQNPMFHTFAMECSSRLGGSSQPRSTPAATTAPPAATTPPPPRATPNPSSRTRPGQTAK